MLSSLPQELLCHILLHLPPDQVLLAGATCRALCAASRSEHLWEKLVRRWLGLDTQLSRHPGASVRRLYQGLLRTKGRTLGLWQRNNLKHHGTLHQVQYMGKRGFV